MLRALIGIITVGPFWLKSHFLMPRGIFMIIRFQINVWAIIFLVSSTLQNSLNDICSFNGGKGIHKKLFRCTLTDFRTLWADLSLGTRQGDWFEYEMEKRGTCQTLPFYRSLWKSNHFFRAEGVQYRLRHSRSTGWGMQYKSFPQPVLHILYTLCSGSIMIKFIVLKEFDKFFPKSDKNLLEWRHFAFLYLCFRPWYPLKFRNSLFPDHFGLPFGSQGKFLSLIPNLKWYFTSEAKIKSILAIIL